MIIKQEMLNDILGITIKTASGSTYAVRRNTLYDSFILESAPESFRELVGKEVKQIGPAQKSFMGNNFCGKSEYFGMLIPMDGEEKILATSQVRDIRIDF